MEIIEKVKKKKLVFTVATGRCGTAYFAEILRLIPNVTSLHEPAPEYAEVLREIQENPNLAKEFLCEHKLPSIKSVPSSIYIETSHLFCKGFLQPLLDFGIVPALLWIRRDHRAVASSMFRGGTIPGRTEKGLRFYLSPEDAGVLSLPDWRSFNDYQLCYWYCLEIERRALEYREVYNKNDWLWSETSIDEITTRKGMSKVIKELELPQLTILGWLRYLKNRRNKVNPTLASKKQIQLPRNLDSLEKEVSQGVGEELVLPAH